tara:strand:- start:4509 stop:5480 length:972 start_codon:yes stop_codon:yes gene_type:complete
MNKNKTFIIAEIGINHDGNLLKAKKLIFLAKKGGADAVKFQLFSPGDLYLKNDKNYNSAKKFSLNKKDILKLRNYSKKIKIKFFCTPFSKDKAEYLNEIKTDGYKIASMDSLNINLIRKCLSYNKPVIISTGMLNLKEHNYIFNKFKGKKNIYFLHCISTYPTPNNKTGLNVLDFFKKKLGKNSIYGYSDHSINTNNVKIAIAKGARIIEKHFTLFKRNKYDHIHSMNFEDLKSIVEFSKLFHSYRIKKDFLKNRIDSKNAKIYRRGIYTKEKIKKNEKLELNKLNFVRPQKSSHYLDLSMIKNKKAKKNLKKNTLITISKIF